jgi:hypothetical protein
MAEQPQWFPVISSTTPSPFLVDGQRSGAIGAEAKATLSLDTFPELLYAVRFTTSYELPPATFGLAPAFKQQMREGGVDDDFTVQVLLTQQNITSQAPAHLRNFQGALQTNLHPLPIPYPFRGGNRFDFTARRVSSYPQLRVDEQIVQVLPQLFVTIIAARGVQSVADNVTSPKPPPSTGFP